MATELGITLAKKGHEVHVISYRQPVKLEMLGARIHFHEVHVPEYPLFKYQPYELALSSKLVDVVRSFGIELLHVHYAIPHAYAGYMAKKMLAEEGISIPMVTTLHGTDITLVGRHPFYKPAVTFSINKSDVVTSVSESLRKSTLEQFDIKVPIHVIPNFIDFVHYPDKVEDCNRDMMAAENERIVTHVSNFRKVKRTDDVVRVFHNIQKQLPARLIMVGEGPEREFSEQLCRDLQIADKVTFIGNSDEVNKILCFSDLFLLPSETESFGLAALEAMAAGVPVVSSDAGGIGEVNTDGKSGYLCPVGDVEMMSAKALEILSDDTVLKKFKAGAKETARRFDIDLIVPAYEKCYEETL